MPQRNLLVVKWVNNQEQKLTVVLVYLYYLRHLCVRVQSEELQASFTPPFALNISGGLLNKAVQDHHIPQCNQETRTVCVCSVVSAM